MIVDNPQIDPRLEVVVELFADTMQSLFVNWLGERTYRVGCAN
jgi:hypothetical protein